MKLIVLYILFIILIICCLPFVSAVSDDSLVKNISNSPFKIPTTGRAILGSKESMSEYQSWLNKCSFQLIEYSNIILRLFGQNGFNWSENSLATPTITLAPSLQVNTNAVQTLSIPDNPRLKTVATINGQSGQTSSKVMVPSGYWELWYTADPLITGGQDSHSASGTNSAVFPSLSIQITNANTGEMVDTVEPPGGLDITLWQRAGDPRPWSQKFYEGNKEYSFDITAKHLKSYIIEIRVPRD